MSDNNYKLAEESAKAHRLMVLLGSIRHNISVRIGGSALSERQYTLLGHIVRAGAMSRSCLLLAEAKALEEIWIISRSLAELVINCGYLYVASDEEVKAFIYFDGHKIFSQASKLIKHRPPEGQFSEEFMAEINVMVSDARARSGLEDKERSWSRFKDLASRAMETDKHYVTKDFYTMYLAAVPYGNAGTHSTFLSLVWSLNSLTGQMIENNSRHALMLGGAMHIVVLALNLLCLLLDERHALGIRQEIVQACS